MRTDQIAKAASRAPDITVGSRVQVYTRLGKPVCEGIAAFPTEAGICIADQFYPSRLYRFVVTEQAQALDGAKTLTEQPELAEAKIGNNKAAKEGKPHPDNLPDDIHDAVITTSDLSEPQINRVLSAIGDAALRILKDLGVDETEVYGRVHEVQVAVKAALQPTAKDKKKAKQRKQAAEEDE